MDKRFRIEVISQTPNPQQTMYAAMHQDYAEGFVWDERDQFPDERKAGEIVVKRLLNGGRGHFGVLEHPQIVLNCGWFPHSTMQQLRTHRTGISFDVQSFRYTGARIAKLGKVCEAYFSSFPDLETVFASGEDADVDDIFYLRPVGFYTDRNGKKYEYTAQQRAKDLAWCGEAAMRYLDLIEEGFSEEHARGIVPFDARQHWIMSANARTIQHLLDLRFKGDAQLECQWFCEHLWNIYKAWVPEVAAWYEANRLKKARLSP